MAMETSGNFRLRRILVWLNPEKYASEGGYQIMQALYAIGSGGFFGKGLGNSAQKMIIPEVQNDMILSIICEELGVFGLIVVLVLFGIWCNHGSDPVRNASVQIIIYCAECTGSLWFISGERNICTYCIAGNIKCYGCDQLYSDNRNHTSLYQLWRYVGAILNGGNGTGIGSLFKD